MSRPIPRWVLPVLLVLNSLTSIAIASRAAELRQAAEVWDLRAGAWLLGGSNYKHNQDRLGVESRRAEQENGKGRRTRRRKASP